MPTYTTAGLHTKVGNALREFFREDKNLLCLEANERSITHKFAEHLQRQFADLDVDCEYNRRNDKTKRLPCKRDTTRTDCLHHAKRVFPDIIVHKRGCDISNMLVIEVKKSNRRGVKRDKSKLHRFTCPDGWYGYELGLLLVFYVGNQKGLKRAECFQDGEKTTPSCSCCKRLLESFRSAA